MRDTLSAVRDLEAAGIDSMHAEAIVGVIANAREELATKADLEAAVAMMKADLEAAVATMRAELEAAVATMKADLEAAVATMRAELEAAVATTRAERAAAVAALEARIERAMNRNLLATIAVGGVIIAAVKLL